jgi:hypothetical protein
MISSLTAALLLLWLLGARLMFVADERDIFAHRAPYLWLYLLWPLVALGSIVKLVRSHSRWPR